MHVIINTDPNPNPHPNNKTHPNTNPNLTLALILTLTVTSPNADSNPNLITRKKHSESADLRQGSLLPTYGVVPCTTADLSCKFHQNLLIKHTSTDNCSKMVFPQQNF